MTIPSLDRLTSLLARVHDLNMAANVLEWDQETYMPEAAAEARAHQIATLRQLAHECFVSDEIGALLDALDREHADADPDHPDVRLLRVTRRDYDQATRLPARLVADLARAVALGKEAWKTARDTDTFATFEPALQRLVDLNLEKAEALGYADTRYDALLDQYEPGLDTATVRQVFDALRAALVPIVRAIAGQPPPDDRCLHRYYPQDRQWDFGMAVLRDIGFDFTRGRQDLSAHPFTTAFDISDVRLTTRVNERYFPSAFFGSLHEAGHGLYEQGIDPALARTPLADGASLGMHESQSRLWENLIGRSRAFWEHYYAPLQRLFPEALSDVSLDTFYRAINRVEPSLIRVEADEVTYNLHIMLRFELELALIEGSVAPADLPALWNAKMEDYLGLTPDTDANGVLQDVHWSLGAFGYFPTYALGNLLSAQLYDRLDADLGGVEPLVAAGDFAPILAWLREHVHRFGRSRSAQELMVAATGSGLQAGNWLAYVRRKYEALYDGLSL